MLVRLGPQIQEVLRPSHLTSTVRPDLGLPRSEHLPGKLGKAPDPSVMDAASR